MYVTVVDDVISEACLRRSKRTERIILKGVAEGGGMKLHFCRCVNNQASSCLLSVLIICWSWSICRCIPAITLETCSFSFPSVHEERERERRRCSTPRNLPPRILLRGSSGGCGGEFLRMTMTGGVCPEESINTSLPKLGRSPQTVRTLRLREGGQFPPPT